ncbi:hypothetical protein MAHJHV57_50230 [Mycobacterium avium subsp. hominissuis]
MFGPTTDYNQQLLAYLQAWRELLERWTAMCAATPAGRRATAGCNPLWDRTFPDLPRVVG